MGRMLDPLTSAVAVRCWTLWGPLCLLAGLLLLLVSGQSGDSGQVSPPTEPSPAGYSTIQSRVRGGEMTFLASVSGLGLP